MGKMFGQNWFDDFFEGYNGLPERITTEAKKKISKIIRDEIVKRLKKHNIQININYPYPVHQIKEYIDKIKLPVTEKMSKGIFSLPLYPNLKINDLIRVTKVLKKILIKI